MAQHTKVERQVIHLCGCRLTERHTLPSYRYTLSSEYSEKREAGKTVACTDAFLRNLEAGLPRDLLPLDLDTLLVSLTGSDAIEKLRRCSPRREASQSLLALPYCYSTQGFTTSLAAECLTSSRQRQSLRHTEYDEAPV